MLFAGRQKYLRVMKTLLGGRVALKSVQNMEVVQADGSVIPRTTDPYIIVDIGNKEICRVTISIKCKVKSKIKLYYSYEKTPGFTEDRVFELGVADGKTYQKLIKFSKPVRWFRLDPVDCKEEFVIHKLEIEYPRESSNECICYESSLERIRDFCAAYNGDPQKLLLLITHDMTKTGAPLLCAKISKQLQQLDYTPIVLSMSDMEVPQYWAEVSEVVVARKVVQNLKSIIEELKKIGLDKAIVNTVVCGSCLPILKRNNIKVVSLIHEMRSACEILQAEDAVCNISENADVIVFPAKQVYKEFASFLFPIRGRVMICPQGYYRDLFYEETENKYASDLLKQLGVAEEEDCFVFCGTAYFGKGIDLLPQLAKRYIEKTSPAHFIWLGEFADRNMEIWIRNEVKRMGMEKYVHFAGLIEDEREYCRILQGATAFVLSSREDSFPSVLMEAMAMRLPVIAFKQSGGAEELLNDGKGFLVDYLDLDEMVMCMQKASERTKETLEVVEKAYKYVKTSMKFRMYVQTLLEQF